jgi:cytochrome oxidase Cu insertion factor (SCO1/SenC/PrrC family)
VADSRAPPHSSARAKRTLLLLAAVCIAPVLASYAVYYLFPRSAAVNYGTLLPTAAAPAIEGTSADGTPFRLVDLHGRWVLMLAESGGCDAGCERRLYATRQARVMQGKERDRIVRVWFGTPGALPAPEVLAQDPGLVVVRVSRGALSAMPGGERGIWLVDPLGNLVLTYPDDPDIRGIANDFSRLLRASGIG